jgi:probable F420-dependent oxidoreductase
VKFGLRYCNIGPLAAQEPSLALARYAEAAGFESIWTIEHVVIPVEYRSAYPYAEDGRFGWDIALDYPDPLVWLAVVAGATERIKLGTAILILPQRNPVVLAKASASLDALSGGRLLLGIGVGWLREEFEAIGASFADRGRRTDEAVAAMRALWRDTEPTFAGDEVRFERALCNPKPLQPGGVPILIGGDSPVAARRAGRLGDGYFPARATPETLPALVDEMRRAARAAGRDPDDIEITGGSVYDYDGARRFEHLGVARVMCPLMLPDLVTDLDDAKRKIDRFVNEISGRF